MDDQETAIVRREPEGVEATERGDLLDGAGAGFRDRRAEDVEDAGMVPVRLEVEEGAVGRNLGGADDEVALRDLKPFAGVRVHQVEMGVAGFLGQEEDRPVVRQPAQIAKGVVDPGGVGHPVQGAQFAGFEVDSGDPAVLVVRRVDLHDGPGSIPVEGYRTDADRPGPGLLLIGLFLTGLVVLPFDRCRFLRGSVFAAAGQLRRRFPGLLPFARRFAQVGQGIVRDARQHGEVERHGFRVAGSQQEQRFAGRLRRADLHPDLFDLDHAGGGDVVRHPVPETLVALFRTGSHDEAVERGRQR